MKKNITTKMFKRVENFGLLLVQKLNSLFLFSVLTFLRAFKLLIFKVYLIRLSTDQFFVSLRIEKLRRSRQLSVFAPIILFLVVLLSKLGN